MIWCSVIGDPDVIGDHYMIWCSVIGDPDVMW